MNKKKTASWRRQKRVRAKIHGTSARPRLCVFRSGTHTYVQLIDDVSGKTLAAASTRTSKEKTPAKGGRKDAARAVGTLISEMAKLKGIEQVIFDRRKYKYHGRVAAVADGARAGGLKF